MTRRSRPPAGRWWAMAGLTAVGLAYATLASRTRPFTGEAEVATGVPLVTAVVVMAVRTAAARRSAVAETSARASGTGPGSNRWPRAWITILAVIAGWEVYCYASLPRSEHPTLSTLIDLLDSTAVGKVLAFALWLALGGYLVCQ